MDGNTARHAGFHCKVDAGADGLIPDLGARQCHELFVGGDDGFAIRDGGLNDFARERGAADQFRDNLHVGIRNDFAPVGGTDDVFEAGRKRFFHGVKTANGSDTQCLNSELPVRSGSGVVRQNGDGAGADVAEDNHTNVDVIHFHYCLRVSYLGL